MDSPAPATDPAFPPPVGAASLGKLGDCQVGYRSLSAGLRPLKEVSQCYGSGPCQMLTEPLWVGNNTYSLQCVLY